MVKEVYKNIDYTMSGVREDDAAMKHKLLPHYKLRPAKMDGRAKGAAEVRVSLYLDHLLDSKYLDEYFANRK